ncbi:general transcription factor II-I repeat domain-containing protein 2A-like [Octopus sinensis]|uniref:General transcription factor II-I repeat domain-containing protein 2A-like n=1 Tax=Octopus sinensis TaxID=2607531 RepID=A0A6P7T5U3_9MOLL|nr:general transcription factor II-I repeat domain-containing protein 2A-like [Octopus sinensis]
MVLFKAISLSLRMVTRRVDEMSADVKNQLINAYSELQYFSIAVDENIGLSDTAQLAVFVRGGTSTFQIFEEFIQLIPVEETVTGADIFEAFLKMISEMKNRFKSDRAVIDPVEMENIYATGII